MAACAHEHAERWLNRPALYINVEALLADPHRAAAQLGRALGVAPAALARRAPRRRLLGGKLAELAERLTGRESTEVRVLYPKNWANPDEPAAVNARCSDLHAELARRSLV